MSFIRYVNRQLLLDAKTLHYTVKDVAPNTENSLFNSTSLIVWSGASDRTIFNDASVNYAIRALSDKYL